VRANIEDGSKGGAAKMRKRKVMGTILGIALVFMMIEGLGCAAVPHVFPLADGPVVTFPDPNLEAAIREAIGKPTGDIYQSDLVGLTTLGASSRGITDVTGLEYCTSLTALYLGDNQISDMSALSGLTSLTSLSLFDNQISDLSPLSGLTSLNGLWLDGNVISDISALLGLTSLTTLSLGRNQISDISALSGLNTLTWLNLGINQIGDISSLSSLTSLNYLWLDRNVISNISALSGLTTLITMRLDANDINDISPLSNLISLISLNLRTNQISDISHLSDLGNLTGLYLDYNQIDDISILSNLSSLSTLSLHGNAISDIEPLVNNPGLSTGDTVDLTANPLNTQSVNVYIPELEGRGVTVSWDTANQLPNQPSNVSPASGATGVSLTPTLQSSVFSDPDVGDNHAASQWQITTTSGDYSSPVFDSGTDPANLESIAIPPGTLSESTTYYWHVRYQDNRGDWSSWSAETSFTTEEIVVFPDPNLEAAIREAIGKPTGDIYQSDLEGFTSLDASYRNIADLTGLEYLTNLTDLHLGWNQISDISPLANLTNLTQLRLSTNQISDIWPLASLTNLTFLNLDLNQISDISPLASLTNLTGRLYLQNNQISDISPLASLTNLTELSINGNQINDISPLASLTNLTFIDLGWNPISDISPVANLTNLKTLGFGHNQISDISPVANLTSLRTLTLVHNQINDISPLANLTNLISLDLWVNQISDISPLANLSSLVGLYLQNNQVSDIEPLVNNPGLATGDTVDLRSNPLNTASVNNYILQLEGRGVQVLWDTANQLPNQPSNVSPANGATGVSLTPTLISSAFSDPDLGDNHAASQWQITTTPGDYSSPIFDSGTDPANLESIAIPSGALSESTTYYWHVKHQDNRGDWSSWSAETSFTTAAPPNNPPDQPSNLSPANGATGVSLTPTLTSSAFSDSDVGDTHAASRWQIRTSSGSYSSPVFDSGTDTSDLTSIAIPSGILTYSTTYYWHARHQDNHGAWSSYSSETSFTTIPSPPASPPPITYSLQISSTEGGSVTTPGEGTSAYNEGTVVNIVAIPASGYRFVNWTGNVGTIGNVNDATTTITMHDNYSITANFEQIPPGQFGLTTSSTTGGSVTVPGEGTFAYDAGTVVDLVATPAIGYQFVNWTGDMDTIADVNAVSTTVTMNDNYSITANFVAIYDLTISSTEGGSVTTPGEGTFTYDKGTVVDLVAEAEEGYRFVDWTGDVDTIVDVEVVETAITMEGSYEITANFEKSGGCFIATAAYGTPMAEEIQILREFRDEYLFTNPLGKALVGLYYQVSPPIAEFITDHPSLKPIMRVGLLPAVAMSAVAVNTTPAEKMAVAGLLVLVSVAVAILAKRRRDKDSKYTCG
jgi:Leucine-rich repeat (LRR) protein